MHMSVAEEAIRKETGRVNAPLECLGAINPPDNIREVYTLTGTAPIIWIQTWWSV